MRYPGGKNCAGTYQRIINQIPPHTTYIEPFAGSAAILRLKRAAARSIALDLDPAASGNLAPVVPPKTELIHGDGIKFLQNYPFSGGEFVYCDPPYLPETCLSRIRYLHKMTRRDHVRLLETLLNLPCQVLISGYESQLYQSMLGRWRTDRFPQITRGGFCVDEWLWAKYDFPTALHDYQYLGTNVREREKFTRRQKRWAARIKKMPALERQALLAALQEASQQSECSADNDRRGDGRGTRHKCR